MDLPDALQILGCLSDACWDDIVERRKFLLMSFHPELHSPPFRNAAEQGFEQR